MIRIPGLMIEDDLHQIVLSFVELSEVSSWIPMASLIALASRRLHQYEEDWKTNSFWLVPFLYPSPSPASCKDPLTLLLRQEHYQRFETPLFQILSLTSEFSVTTSYENIWILYAASDDPWQSWITEFGRAGTLGTDRDQVSELLDRSHDQFVAAEPKLRAFQPRRDSPVLLQNEGGKDCRIRHLKPETLFLTLREEAVGDADQISFRYHWLQDSKRLDMWPDCDTVRVDNMGDMQNWHVSLEGFPEMSDDEQEPRQEGGFVFPLHNGRYLHALVHNLISYVKTVEIVGNLMTNLALADAPREQCLAEVRRYFLSVGAPPTAVVEIRRERYRRPEEDFCAFQFSLEFTIPAHESDLGKKEASADTE